MRLPVEIQAGLVLELQATLPAVHLPPYHDERGHEADNLKVPAKLAGIPDLAVFGFKSFTAARHGVDFGHSSTANVFGRIVHLLFLSCLKDALFVSLI